MGTNFRNVYKSDHLGVIDLEEMIEAEKTLIFTIKEVKQELNAKVAGNTISANIAYFVEDIKPLVLNATNAKVIKQISNSSFIENWAGVSIELYIDKNVKMKGEVVGGVRVKPTSKPKISDTNALSILNSSKTLAELKANWGKLSQAEQSLPSVNKLKDELKSRLS